MQRICIVPSLGAYHATCPGIYYEAIDCISARKSVFRKNCQPIMGHSIDLIVSDSTVDRAVAEHMPHPFPANRKEYESRLQSAILRGMRSRQVTTRLKQEDMAWVRSRLTYDEPKHCPSKLGGRISTTFEAHNGGLQDPHMTDASC